MKQTKLFLTLLMALIVSNIFSQPPPPPPPGPTAANSLAFNGGYVSFSNSALGNFGTGNFTVEFYVNTTATSGAIISKRSICNHSNFWNLLVSPSGAISVEFDNNGTNYVDQTGSIAINDGNWHQVALVRSSGVASLYIDGVLDFSTPMATNINNTTDLELGTNACVNYFTGMIDELRIWNLARGLSQIQSVMHNELCLPQAGLVAYYTFDQGNAGNPNPGIDTLKDSGPNHYNGILNNFGLSGSGSNWVDGVTLSPCSNGWIGALSTDWTNAGNWSVGVPSPTLDATIPPGRTHYPVIASGTQSVQNMFIQAGGGTLSISAGATLEVYGNWSNNGVASVGNGTVYLEPTSGFGYNTLFGYTSFGNLTNAGNYQVDASTPSSELDVRGVLNLLNDDLETDGVVHLKASATQTALIQTTGGTMGGQITMEQYIGGVPGYHHLSSPMSDATVGSWAGSFAITGTDGTGAFIANREGTLQQYIEPTNFHVTLDSGYYNYTGLSDPLVQGTGYTAYLKTLPITLKTFGTPNYLSDVSITITKTAGENPNNQGWNFIGNPFPSPMSWTTFKNFNPGTMNGTCYIWRSTGLTSGTWTAYNGTISNVSTGAGDVIASQQGFWILGTTASATVTFPGPTEATPATVNYLSAVFYKAPAMQDNEIRLGISSQTDEGSEAVAYTLAGANDGYDAALDAPVPPATSVSQSPVIAYAIGGRNYLIHATDAINENTEMPLSVHIGAPGSYQIRATELNVADYPAYLLDKTTNTYYDLSKETATVQSQGNEDINSRYSVVFSKKATAALPGESNTNIYGISGAIVVNMTNTEVPAHVIVTNLLGQQIINTTVTDGNIQLPVETTNAIYLVSVKQGSTETIRKVFVK